MSIVLESAESIFDPALYDKVRLPLEEAETLPPWCYTSEAFYRAEVEHMFMKVWNLLGRADRIPNPGDFFTIKYVGIPIIFVRGEDGEVHAYSNSCRHRGTRLAVGEGNCKSFVCPYHGWAYGLDGSLRAAPGMDETAGFDFADYGLVPLRLETWGGFLFVNFDGEAPPLLDYLGNLPVEMASYGLQDLVLTNHWSYDVACNWKLHIENAMEDYHVPWVHSTSLDLKDVEFWNVPTEGNWFDMRERHEGTRALLEEDAHHGFPRISTLQDHADEGTNFVCVAPSTCLALTTDCFWYVELHPQGPGSTTVSVGTCFPKETVARPDFDEKVQYYYKRWRKSVGEDNNISTIQQEGLASPFVTPGRLSRLEPLVRDLGEWWIDWVIDRGATARKG